MVRAAPACAHPSLHGEAAARGDRAGLRARLSALPVRLAGRLARCAHGRPAGARCGGRAACGLRGASCCMGRSDPARAARLTMSPACSTMPALPGRVAWARLERRPKPKSKRKRAAPAVKSTPISLFPRSDAPHLGAPRRPIRSPPSAPEPRKSRTSSARTAPPSSTRSSMARISSARRSRRRLPSLSAWGQVISDSFGGLRALLTPPRITGGGHAIGVASAAGLRRRKMGACQAATGQAVPSHSR